ncbi:12732_t:CDS:2, partial [Acaulospora morrowiae]
PERSNNGYFYNQAQCYRIAKFSLLAPFQASPDVNTSSTSHFHVSTTG